MEMKKVIIRFFVGILKIKSLHQNAAVIVLLLIFGCNADYQLEVLPEPITCPGIPTIEYQGVEYPTVLIGEQCWMAKNLDIGIQIHSPTEMTNNDIIEKYCYDDDSINCQKYGGLYQWGEIMHYSTSEGAQGICPDGWHIPTNKDFADLFIYANGIAEYLIKCEGLTDVDCDDGEHINAAGFSALASGAYTPEYSYIVGPGFYSHFWTSKMYSSDRAIIFHLGPNTVVSYMVGAGSFKNFFSVRCIKDQ